MGDFELRLDYDHDGRLTGSQSEYDARQSAPGALIVANADADRRALPATVSAGSDVDLDFTRYTPSGGDDEILPLVIRINNPAAIAGRSFGLRVPGIHGVRFRFYDDTGRILPVIQWDVPGEHPITLPNAPETMLRVETRAYPGSPFGYATLFELTYDPTSDREDQSGLTLELFSRDAAKKEIVHDQGRMSVAPVLFLDHSAPATRLYICDKPETLASVTDLKDALRLVPGVTLVTVPQNVAGPDTWLQDQFQPGIVVGSDGWRHAIVHLPRLRSNFVAVTSPQNLASFVTSHFPAHDVGLMNDFWDRTLSFSDKSGAQQTLKFTELVKMANLMDAVSGLIGYYDEVISLVDKSAQRHNKWGWAEARRNLRPLLDELKKKLTEHGSGGGEWGKRVKATIQDAEGRLSQLEKVISIKGQGQSQTFVLPAGNRTVEVDEQLADELHSRIAQMQSSGNYGGNIEVAPPSAAAPLGTIVIGNAALYGRMDHMDPDVRRFLYRQKQPVLEIDTTWLDVGHVDEVVTFVPDKQGESVSFAALRASSSLAMRIIRRAGIVHSSGFPWADPHSLPPVISGYQPRLDSGGQSPITRLMRGKLWLHSHPRPASGSDLPTILEPPRIYQRLAQIVNGGDARDPSTQGVNITGIYYRPGPGADRAYGADMTVYEIDVSEQDGSGNSVNDFVEAKFLTPLEKRLTGYFPGMRTFPMPVVFDRVASAAGWDKDPWEFSTSAFTPNVVNMQVLGDRLLIPRPYGPRMRADDVTTVLTAVLSKFDWGPKLTGQLNANFYRKFALDKTVCWVVRQEKVQTTEPYADTIYKGLMTADDVAEAFQDGFPGKKLDEIAKLIRADNAQNFAPDGRLREGLRRFTIKEGMVDLFEAYIQLVATALGLKISWIDAWFYHQNYGGIHCGTNLLREPPPGKPPQWWKP